ncbi:unnamed protein product [Rhizoctonia solani]|uniref:Polyketide synthase-like phosphopantetheine-binding domain-containing protein n=1 Tax=Rhizoctonia solani TaxID=456999 RepID=A0A8H3D476_9AGAM|nr:unnamed protein product [Rhizoctonia solani]
MALPTFHCMGIILQVLAPLYLGYTQALFAPALVPVMPNPKSTLEAIANTNCAFLICVPAFLEAWAYDEDAIDILKSMKGILFGGGPLTDVVGDRLANHGVRIYPLYGATEVGVVNVAPPHDQIGDWPWNYIKLSPHLSPHFIPHDDQDNTFELVFEAGEGHNPFVLNSELNNQPIYSTRDLMVPHPSKSGLWKFVGRVDDRIVLLNGEKTNPGSMEAEIVKCPLVQCAIMFGQARNQTGVLIELKNTPGSLAEIKNDRRGLIGKIWSYIERANQTSATHSRLDQRAVIFVDPARPLPRTPKDTIPRSAALKLYAPDIEEMYAALERDLETDVMDDIDPPEEWIDPSVLSAWIAGHVESILDKDIDLTVDLFQQGMDSLTATILLRTLKAVLHASHDPNVRNCAQILNQMVIFDNPTVQQLSLFLVQSIISPRAPTHTPVALESIQAMIRKYDSNWPRDLAKHSIQRSSVIREHIAVTGTTGGLGSHLLAQLLADDKVERVWALNRKSNIDIRDRQRVSFEDKMLDTGLLASEKLVFVDAVLGDVKLELSNELYDEIRNTATIIIHNAWQVNFNLALQSFEQNIQGTRNLLDLAFSSTARTGLPRLAFTSSVSVVGLSGASGCLDEVSVRLEDAASTTGYGQSKLVAEKLLESARNAGLQTCIIRLGQLTGDIKSGSWTTTDWVPSIIASSLSVGCLPAAVGMVSWLPLDVAALSIVDTCTARDKELPPVIHASHPHPVPWVEIMTAFATLLTSHRGSILPILELSEWNKRVAERTMTFRGSHVDRYKCFPSTKIQSTMDGIALADQQLRSRAADEGVESAGTVRLITTKAEQMSEGLRNTPRLGREHVERWIKYWEARGLFANPPHVPVLL